MHLVWEKAKNREKIGEIDERKGRQTKPDYVFLRVNAIMSCIYSET